MVQSAELLLIRCSGFSEKQYAVNWISGWVEQETLQYDWRTAGAAYTYIVRSNACFSPYMCMCQGGCAFKLPATASLF